MQTEVDLESGSIMMKKFEQWLNTFSYLVTYLLRCNTDVTSLRSGTAIKSVLLYVTNYVTKASLKTHAVFDTIRSIFERNPDVVGGSDTRKEKARKLMTKIVNSLSAKMEMGNPMICLYILGNPDHYKSHHFQVFYWMSFIKAARSPWVETDSLEQKNRSKTNNAVTMLFESAMEQDKQPNMEVFAEKKESVEKVTILRYNNQFIGLSLVHDYIYRCEDLHNLCLYDWIARCERTKLTKKQQLNRREGDNEDDVIEEECPVDKYPPSHHGFCVSETTSGIFPFLSEHPLAKSHGTRCRPVSKEKVPNFVGPTLPRCDQGDREFYCSVMLTLFKPWRSGLELKKQEESWDDALRTHNFSDRQKDIMRNFNIRYECLDAQDDFHSQFTKGDVGINSWEDADKEAIRNIEDIMADDVVQGELSMEHRVDELSEVLVILGKREKARTRLMSEMRTTLQNHGWTESISSLLHQAVGFRPLPPEVKLNGAEWKMVVAHKRIEVLQLRIQNMPATSNSMTNPQACAANSQFVPDNVHVVTKSYLSHSFISKEWQDTIEDISTHFGLNKEQGRAFRIVANHSCDPDSEQLNMYVGGMAGTGKSQVLRALSKLFFQRKELYRLLILAPTGSAAALLGGSTYHSALGISSDSDRLSSTTQLSQIKSRLLGVQYIFLDEVSMLSCREMYLISEKLARILNNPDMPFGGMNMIFAGDFAQLPPAIGGEHTSLYSRTAGQKATSLYDQQAAIGKALWHQVTTVVILRQNMRQRSESVEDARFREVLSNMRYKACTVEDIDFLRSRVSSNLPNRPSINDARFRNVSIITCLNSLKDEINRLGALRFAKESSQNLVDFYSIDTLPSEDAKNNRGRKQRMRQKHRDVFTEHGKIKPDIQKVLWEQPPCANTKLVPGKLSLCIGMPVMIRHNIATELCMTKGQEGSVHGWQFQLINGVNTLDTLFIQLHNPPTPVKLDGLPLNVVPLAKNSVTTTCNLPDDSSLDISRSQPDVLPNFAMTDFASQGKTRENNVVDLSYSRSHQGYYTSLSRGMSAAGTLILGGFHPSKIMGGASGALRQEFRDLELLDEITTLHYENKLPKNIAMADRRNTIVALFREMKGLQHMPSKMHGALRWNKRDPYLVSEGLANNVVEWRIIEPRSAKKVQLASEISTNNKRDQVLTEKPEQNKKLKSSHGTASHADPHLPPKLLVPIGTQWENNSCAYDAICTVLFNIWREDPAGITLSWNELDNDLLVTLTAAFETHVDFHTGSPSYSLEQIRDDLRHHLACISDEFRFGRYASVHAVMNRLLESREPVTMSIRRCRDNHPVDSNEMFSNSCEIMTAGASSTTDHGIQEHMDNFSIPLSVKCLACEKELVRSFSFAFHPPLLCIELWQGLGLLDSILNINAGGLGRRYKLRGIIYFSGEHFTSRIIARNGLVWFHDGMFTGSSLVYESADFSTIPIEGSILAVYIRC